MLYEILGILSGSGAVGAYIEFRITKHHESKKDEIKDHIEQHVNMAMDAHITKNKIVVGHHLQANVRANTSTTSN